MSEPEIPLVRSKLLVPSSSGLLHRSRVCQAIERGLECQLTMVCAPAGYGKTSALVDFAHHSSVPVCWYTGDERDRDLATFVEYLVASFRERFPGFGSRTRAALRTERKSQLGNPELPEPSHVLAALANEILELDSPHAVVVDNYDALDGALGIRTFVNRLLQVLPSNCHLILCSRVLAAVPITRLVAKRELVGLADRDLRFTPQEIQALLRLSEIEISETQAQAMAANSEGWITGILLLADSLREGASAIQYMRDKKATVETYDYLATEVLSRQPPDIQHFLRTSSVLREMSVWLCRQVLQIQDPHPLLAEITRRNLFVTYFGNGSAATYRYHSLFRDFLHEQLRQRGAADYVQYHRRAAELFERENDIEEAVYHYLAADIYPQALALMEQVAGEWFTRGRVETLLDWAEKLPEQARAQTPRLALYTSRAFTGRYDYQRAQQALAAAETGFAADRDTPHLAKVHNQRALLNFLAGHYEEAIAEARTALQMLGQEQALERAQAQRHVGKAYVGSGRLAEGVAELEQALALFRQVGSLYDVANLLQDLTWAFTAQGRFDEAHECVNEALTISRRLDAPTLLAGVLNDAGCLHHARGQYHEALMLYEEGLAAGQRGGDLRLQAYISVGMADVYRDLGAYDRAAPLYDAGWQMAHPSEPGLAVYILAALADMYRWQGRHAQALASLEQAQQLAQSLGLAFEERGLLPVLKGAALAEAGEPEAGLHLLTDGIHFLEQRQAKRELARAYFLLAKVHLLRGDETQALVHLGHTLHLAQVLGTDQFVVAEGQHAEQLLSLSVAAGIATCRSISAKVQQLRAFGEEQDTTTHLEIYAFGEGRVSRDGHVISSSEWRAAQARELFFYILLHGPLERAAIGLVFWPDASPKRMAANFHTTLYRIRRALGADTVIAEGGQYRLGDVDYWFDVQEFEDLVERARLLPPHDWQADKLWRRAVALYQGDFLPEVGHVWCVPKRESLREMYTEALIGLGHCQRARRNLEEAISWYRSALEVDELREDVHRHIMSCYAETGRRAEALAQYHRCREILQQELGVEPSAATKELYQRIAGNKPG